MLTILNTTDLLNHEEVQLSHTLQLSTKDMGQKEQIQLNDMYELTHYLLHDLHVQKDMPSSPP
jgi:hypothetical protein